MAKAIRVFVFGLVSVLTPVYLAALGYSPILVGSAIATIVGGNALSNVLLTRFGYRFGGRHFLMLFSALMVVSGLTLFATTSYPLILLACFIGNISTTGTEAGPFQSVEVGVLPGLVSPQNVSRSLGIYNMIGYGMASLGAFAASAPSYLHDASDSFRYLYIFYAVVGLTLFVLYRRMSPLEPNRRSQVGQATSTGQLSPSAKRQVFNLSALFSVDAFAGSLVSQSLLVYWFYLVYGVSLQALGVIFFFVNIITAVSVLGASYLAERIGNLRVMVYTHLISNAFLILIPLAGSLPAATSFLFARQSVSQMDVPTRQAFMTDLFADGERVSALATTNTSRILSSILGSPIAGFLMGVGLASLPLISAGLLKVAYDGAIFAIYRKRVR